MSRTVGGSNVEAGRARAEEQRRMLERLLRERAARARTFPPSFGQERLWFIDRLAPGQASYNIPAAVRVRGALDVPALERALAAVVARHEILRTTFPEQDGRPVQRVAPALDVPLEIVDLTAKTAAQREWEVRARATAEARRPFDLERGPLVRASLLRLTEDEHVLLFCMQHIIADGWSMGVLVREVAALYPAIRAGRPNPLGELPIQYADFAAWQREHLDGARLEALLAWWKDRLGGAPTLELPTDRPRPAVQSFRGGELPFEPPAALAEAIERLAASCGATPFMAWFAAFVALLSRWTGQLDVVAGTPVACRTRPELHGLIGLFVNTLALRVDLGGRPTFRELIGRVREVVSGALEHQELPFEKLVEELHPRRDLSRTPLFQVMFVLQNLPATELRLGEGTSLEPVAFDSGIARFDLTVILGERDGRTSGTFEYNADLFEAATIKRFAAAYRALAGAAVAAPDLPVAELPAMPAEERRRVVHDWNETRRPRSGEPTAHGMVEAWARARPDALAVDGGQTQMTYAELDRRANGLARHLRALGVGTDVIVGISMRRSPSMFAAILGVLKAGGAYLPLDPDYPEDRLAYMVRDARAHVIVTERALVEHLARHGTPLVVLEDLDVAGETVTADAPQVDVRGGDLAYVIYTSGSTGRPKGTLLAHEGLVNLIRFQERALEITPGSRVLQFAALSYDASVWEAFQALGNGATLVVAPPDRLLPGPDLVRLLDEMKVTHLTVPPSVLSVLEPAPLPELRTLVVAGEACRADLVARWSRGRTFLNAYGPTETTVCATIHRCEGVTSDPPIGRPIDNFRTYVLDAELEPVPIGVPGELYVGGTGLARGYLGRPELTAERFVPDRFGDRPGSRLYRTGDVCRWREGGVLEFLGRADQQVKLRGFRIELGEIEAALAAQPEVNQAVAVLRAGRGGEPAIVAYVTPADGARPEPATLRESLGARLPEFMVPASIVVLETFPLSPSGKADRAALPDPGAPEPASYVAPRTRDEEEMAALWAELLGLERVSVGDDFFALGGHSLLAARLVARVRDRFGVELPLRRLFERPTVAGLAEELTRARVAARDPIERLSRDGDLPLSFAQERLWFLDRLVPGSSFYNMPAAVRLRGPADVALIGQALGEVVRRHEVLHTRFLSHEGAPALRIDPALPVEIPLDDLRALDANERERAVERLATAEAQRPFDLARGPLLRAHVLMLGPEEHVLLLTLHHIVADGWSMGVLVREMGLIYAALAAGSSPPLADLGVQYADYAAWQRRRLDGERLAEQLEYWRGQLDRLPVLELPTDRPRPAVRTFRGAAHRERWSRGLASQLKATSDRHGVTPFMTLLAAFQLLLARYSGQSDFAVGTPVAGRERTELEPLIGCFVNTLVLRTDLAGDPTFSELLARVRETCLEAFAHQELPFEKLVDEIGPARDLSRESLFQVMFVLQNVPLDPLRLPGGMSVEPVELEGGAAKFELTAAFDVTPDGVSLSLQYNRDLFHAETIERMAAHLRQLVETAVADPEARLSGLSMFDEGERERLLHAWNPPSAGDPDPKNVLRCFEERAAERPSAVAVADVRGRLLYGELDARANRLARHLRSLGAGPETIVAIATGRRSEMLVAELATLKAGAAYLPIDPTHPSRRVAWMLEDSRTRIVVTLAAHAALVQGQGREVVRLDADAEEIAQWSGTALDLDVTAEQLAYVIYTSGSTGRPKGVAVSHGALGNLVAWHLTTYALGPSDRTTQIAAETFDAAVWEVWPALASGASLEIVPDDVRVEPDELRRGLAEREITVSFLPTPLAEAVLERRWPAPLALRALLTGGDRLHRGPASELPFRLINHYGPTENAVVATAGDVATGGRESGPPSIGLPISEVEAYVLDDALEPVPLGATGELYVGGASLARGYAGRPELTAERFVPNPHGPAGSRLYRTGDRCRRRVDGRLDFIERADQQVKLRGFRIELGEIEAALAEHPDVSRAFVVLEGAGASARLVAYVVPSHGDAPPSDAALRAHLAERVPDYMVPSSLRTLADLPLTAHGKIDRAALPVATPDTRAPESFVEPRTDLERQLAGIWCEVLGLERVGVRESFFELGGHSLASVRVVDAIASRLGRRVAVTTLFRNPTVETLAVAMEQGSEADAVLVELRSGSNAAPLFLVHQDTGLAISYLPLAQGLEGDLAVFGLQAPGLDGEEPVLDSVEAMARRYLDAVRRVQPHGPYRLGGHSFGGYVAFEMARLLESDGETVEHLALIDTSPPGPRRLVEGTYDDTARLVAQTRALERFLGLSLDLDEEKLRALESAVRIERVLERVREVRADVEPGPRAAVLDMLIAGGAPKLEASLAVGRACTTAALAYRPEAPYGGAVTLYRSQEIDPGLDERSVSSEALGWDKLALGGVLVHRVEGDHQSMIVEPHVAGLASLIDAALGGAVDSTRGGSRR